MIRIHGILATALLLISLIGLYACKHLEARKTHYAAQLENIHKASGRRNLDQYLLSNDRRIRARAVAQLSQAVRMDPNDIQLKINLYTLLAKSAIEDEDAHALRFAHRLFAQTPEFRYAAVLPPSLVQVYHLQKLHNDPTAVALPVLLKQAIRESPEHLGARIMLAKTYAQAGRYELAQALLGQVLLLEPTHIGATEQLAAQTMQQVNQIDCKAEARDLIYAAIKAHKQVLRLNPGSIDAHADLAWLYKLVGHKELLLFEARRVMQLDDSFDNTLQYASALLWDGQWDTAHKLYTKLLQSEPGHLEALKGLYLLYYMRGDWRLAHRIWEAHFRPLAAQFYYEGLRQYLTVGKLYGRSAAREYLMAEFEGQSLSAWQRLLYQYFKGEMNQELVLNHAVTRCQQTEAHYYFGIKELVQGNAQRAQYHFKQVTQLGVYSCSEYLGAFYALHPR